MLTAEQLKSQLSHFTGTDRYYKHLLGFQYTDGIKFLADNIDLPSILINQVRCTSDVLPTVSASNSGGIGGGNFVDSV